jgi:glutathione S-transferase
MPAEPDTFIEIVAYDWVPAAARGHVRDLRVRWALEEVGLRYRTRLIDVQNKPTAYYAEQPFGQVPAYREGDIHLFECGAIALHIAEKDERLMPRDPAGRARAVSWLFCALNSIDPFLTGMSVIRFNSGDAPWQDEARAVIAKPLERRLALLADALGARSWLEDRFTVGDLMMVATLRSLSFGTLAVPAAISDYVARGEARPAFQAALAAQLADLKPDREGVPA